MYKRICLKRLQFILIALFVMNAMMYVSVAFANQTLRVAITTSVEASGLMAHLKPMIEIDTGLELQVLVMSSGQALQAGRNQDVDVVFTHAPGLEEAFIKDGFAEQAYPIMWNNFMLAGPHHDPAEIETLTDLLKAMEVLYQKQALFISRGDNSGTHQRERDLWKKAQIELNLSNHWYRESGSGQAASLRIASELQAYILTDSASFIRLKESLALASLVVASPNTKDILFKNFYTTMVVTNGHQGLEGAKKGQAWVEWLLSKRGQQAIKSYEVNGQAMFYPIES